MKQPNELVDRIVFLDTIEFEKLNELIESVLKKRMIHYYFISTSNIHFDKHRHEQCDCEEDGKNITDT